MTGRKGLRTDGAARRILYTAREMPLYVYRAKDPARACEACRVELEVLQSMSARRLRKCPECGAPVARVVTSAAMHSVQGPAELRNLGMARLEKRSDGMYENVSAQDGAQRVGPLDSFAESLKKGPKPILSD